MSNAVVDLIVALYGPRAKRNRAWCQGFSEGLKEGLDISDLMVPNFSPAPVPPGVTLELNDDEASTLADILAAVDGPLTSRRLHTNRMSEALDSIGYTHGEALDMWGSIGFD